MPKRLPPNNRPWPEKEAGAVSGYDITTEAAVAKLYYLFSRCLSRDEIRVRMERSMRGKILV